MFEKVVLEQELAQVKAQRKELIATLGKLRKRTVDTGKVAEVIDKSVLRLHSRFPNEVLQEASTDLADYFTTLDDGFDRDEFLRGCGV